MKKQVLMIGCLTLASTSLVLAQDDNRVITGDTMRSETAQMGQQLQGALSEMDVADLEGKDIMDSAGDQLGDIDEVVVNKSNRRMAVIGLEDSTKEVVVDLDKLSLSTDGKTLSTKLTRAELLAMPDYDPMDIPSADERESDNKNPAMLAGRSEERAMHRDLASMESDDLEGKDIMDSAGEQLGDIDKVTTDDSNRRMVVIGLEDSMKEVVVPLDKLSLSADGETLTTKLTRAELLAMPDHDPMDEIKGEDRADKHDPMAMAGEKMDHATDNTVSGALATMKIDELEGKDVMDSAGTQLGDIDEIVVDTSNRRMAVIGLEDSLKEVVVPMDKLSLSADGDTLSTKLTRAELLAMPDYDPMDMQSANER